ncbi:unknown [Firmicutes bacterium CAG:582]|nr:unknown [Firmicutes bacterium CAG:582]
MKFDIDEIIELVNGKRYIVVDKLEENYIWYYNVYEVDDNNNVLDTSLIVKTEVKNGKTLITKTTNEELEKIFKARLN